MKLIIDLTEVEHEYLVLCIREKQREYFSKPSFDFFQKLIDKVEEAKEKAGYRDLFSHRGHSGYCAKCGGDCEYDDEGRKK